MEIKVNIETNAEEEKLYELADEFLGGFYEENGIEQLYDIDDAEY